MANPETRIFCRLDGLTPAAREQKRLAALRELGLLEAQAVAVFDEAIQTAARLLDAPICILGVMTPNYQHIKSAIGLSRVGLMNQLAQSRFMPRSESFCSYVVDSCAVLAIHDTASNPVFASSLLVGHYGIRAYLGAPLLRADGLCLGTLAVMDWKPRCFSTKDIELLAITARWSLSEFERNRLLQPDFSRHVEKSTPDRTPQPRNHLPLPPPTRRGNSWKGGNSKPSQEQERGLERGFADPVKSKLLQQEHTNSFQMVGRASVATQNLQECESKSTTNQQDVSKGVSVCLNSTNSLKLKLLAQLTQELRTPLTSVMGMASVLTRQVYGSLSSKQNEYLEIIHRSGQHLISLVDQIVDLRILDETSEELKLTSVDIEMICQQAINNLLESARSRQQQIRLSVEPGSRIWLLDKDKVRQILYYLVSFVIQLAQAQSVVRIHASRKTDKIKIVVWVSHPFLGEGLPQICEEIAESSISLEAITAKGEYEALAAFYNALESSSGNGGIEINQLNSSTDLPPADSVLLNNSGAVALSLNSELHKTPKNNSREALGLLLSRHLAELHGGEISLQNSLEVGYRYVVTLPLFESVHERL